MKNFLGLLLAVLLLGVTAGVGRSQSSASAPPADQSRYRLMPNDRLAFRIEEDPVKFSDPTAVTVTPLGEIHFQVTRGSDLSIVVNARGKTLAEVKAELKTRLDADYYQNATIFLNVLSHSFQQGKVLFVGTSIKAVVPLRPGETKTLTEAIIQIGYSDFVNLKKVVVERLDPVTKQLSTITVDVDAVIRLKDRSKDLLLQDGDRVKTVDKIFNL